MKTAAEITETIKTAIAEAHSRDLYAIGIRRIGPSRDDSTVYGVGDVLPVSCVWVDGEPTREELSGTCAVRISLKPGEVDDAAIAKALSESRHYIGEQTLLIAGRFWEHGEDHMEVIISDAVVIAVL